MTNKDEAIYRRLHDWWLGYIRSFGLPDESTRRHFEQKRVHSLRVVDEIEAIGRALGLEPRQLLVARAIGLLHDVGRFEQFRRYRTFRDAASLDHGHLGASIVAADGLLWDLAPSEARVIVEAVRCHNKAALPPEVFGEALFFLKLIRDADKLDIFRVVMENAAAAEQALFKMLVPRSEDVSDQIYADLMRTGRVDYQRVGNATDRLLMHAGWVFDINFTPTLRAIAERGYLERIGAALPATPRVVQVLDRARAQLAAGLAQEP